MPSKAHKNGAAPLAQPPVRTLAVPDDLRARIEAAYKVMEEDHPRFLPLQQFFNLLIRAGLENVEFSSEDFETGTFGVPLRMASNPYERRKDQKEAMWFLQWIEDAPRCQCSEELILVIRRFAPHLTPAQLEASFAEADGVAVTDPIHEKGLD